MHRILITKMSITEKVPTAYCRCGAAGRRGGCWSRGSGATRSRHNQNPGSQPGRWTSISVIDIFVINILCIELSPHK